MLLPSAERCPPPSLLRLAKAAADGRVSEYFAMVMHASVQLKSPGCLHIVLQASDLVLCFVFCFCNCIPSCMHILLQASAWDSVMTLYFVVMASIQ